MVFLQTYLPNTAVYMLERIFMSLYIMTMDYSEIRTVRVFYWSTLLLAWKINRYGRRELLNIPVMITRYFRSIIKIFNKPV